MMKEVWRDIKGYEGLYQVSSFGRVKSCERITKVKNVKRRDGQIRDEYWSRCEKILEPIVSKCHTTYVHLYKDGYFRESVAIKRLVAEAFLKDYAPNITTQAIKLKDLSKGARADNLYIKSL